VCSSDLPDGVRALIGFVQQVVAETGANVGIDWHGHRDRGLGLINSIAALRAGASRVHACALGVGERAGNTEMDLLLVNLRLLGWIDNDLSALCEYVKLAHKVIGVPLPSNFPVFGSDAFETGTGVHAAAVIKAFKKGDHWLANRVYSGVPADMVGLEQVIKIGPMSGKSNVIWYLEKRGIEPTERAVDAVLAAAKNSKGLLRDEEILTAARS
jgi:2-isopropylmalate synthase